MAGAITVRAANVLEERVVLLVPVDTLQDVEWDLSPAVWAEFFGGLRADFPDAVEGFFRDMLFAPTSPADVVTRVVCEARAAEPERAVPMLERAREFDLRSALRALRVPIHAINGDRTPTRLDTNRAHAPRWEVELLQGVGHWPMLEDPAGFARALSVVLARHSLSSTRLARASRAQVGPRPCR
jgi:pimeloyl-ACP methyl ester carboxylesterase